jgi:hypothetical protein
MFYFETLTPYFETLTPYFETLTQYGFENIKLVKLDLNF